MNLFYTSSIRKSADQEEYSLEGQEAIHAGKVLRVSEGDTLYATDGSGTIYKGIVSSITSRNINARVTEKTVQRRQVPDVTIAIGNIKKRDRLEFAVEKAVELGVAGIIIFRAGYSEKKRVRLDRLEAAALSAMKQSLRAWKPVVSEAENLENVLIENKDDRIMVADENESDITIDTSKLKDEKHLLFIVGPEGGFTREEMQLAEKAGCEKISLGNYRLRTETAVITLAALISNQMSE